MFNGSICWRGRYRLQIKIFPPVEVIDLKFECQNGGASLWSVIFPASNLSPSRFDN